jgi:hypothetical protein
MANAFSMQMTTFSAMSRGTMMNVAVTTTMTKAIPPAMSIPAAVFDAMFI